MIHSDVFSKNNKMEHLNKKKKRKKSGLNCQENNLNQDSIRLKTVWIQFYQTPHIVISVIDGLLGDHHDHHITSVVCS